MATTQAPLSAKELANEYPTSSNPAARQAVARLLRDSALLAKLANDSDKDVRVAVAENVYTPENTLATLGSDGSPEVRHAVLTNPHSPAQLRQVVRLRELLPVLEEAANSTSPERLRQLAMHADPNVRRTVAKNGAISDKVIEILWLHWKDDESLSVVEGLLRNPNSQKVLESMAANCLYASDDSSPSGIRCGGARKVAEHVDRLQKGGEAAVLTRCAEALTAAGLSQ